jgi:hypothetical protein
VNSNDTFAAAAHLHVLLRRTAGRVTDTEWMATNPQYAQAMVAFASEHAEREGLADLQRLADKLAALIPTMSAPVRKPLLAAAAERLGAGPSANRRRSAWSENDPVSTFSESRPSFADSASGGNAQGPSNRRYVGGIR